MTEQQANHNPQSKDGNGIAFRPKDVENVNLPHSNNLIVNLSRCSLFGMNIISSCSLLVWTSGLSFNPSNLMNDYIHHYSLLDNTFHTLYDHSSCHKIQEWILTHCHFLELLQSVLDYKGIKIILIIFLSSGEFLFTGRN